MKEKKKLSQAMLFILLFGIVSLFSDLTHEGAASIRGAYLALLGASAATIGFVSGLGELVGYSLRYLFGRLTDKTKRYWPMTIIGYVLDILAVPALALVGEDGWLWACGLLVVQRMGKAIKKPAKDTIMSFAASQEGVGKSFGIQEVLDQIGAFLGPVLLYLVMLLKTEGSTFQLYSTCFAVLAIPGTITLALLLLTRRKFPNPERFEPEPKEYVPFRLKKEFILYIAGISLFAFGFIDYSIIIMHVSRSYGSLASGLAETSALVNSGSLPLLYAGAMLVDAVAALFFGLLYDKQGLKALLWSTLLSAPFAVFIFAGDSVPLLLIGVAMWGVGMGAQESILKAAVTSMVPKASRATGYGIFECSFGLFWFLGSWLLGALYDASLPAMIAVSVLAQLAAIPLYLWAGRAERKGRHQAELDEGTAWGQEKTEPPLDNLPAGAIDWREISSFIEDILGPDHRGGQGWMSIEDTALTGSLQENSLIVLKMLYDDLYGFFYRQHADRNEVWRRMEGFIRLKYSELSEEALSQIISTYHVDDR